MKSPSDLKKFKKSQAISSLGCGNKLRLESMIIKFLMNALTKKKNTLGTVMIDLLASEHNFIYNCFVSTSSSP